MSLFTKRLCPVSHAPFKYYPFCFAFFVNIPKPLLTVAVTWLGCPRTPPNPDWNLPQQLLQTGNLIERKTFVNFVIFIHFLYPLNPIYGWGRGVLELESIPAVIGWEAGYTLDRLIVHNRTTQRQNRHNHPHSHSFPWEHANSTQKGPSQDSNREPSCCVAHNR